MTDEQTDRWHVWVFRDTKMIKNMKSKKIKSAVRNTEKHDRSADRQIADLVFRDTLMEGHHGGRLVRKKTGLSLEPDPYHRTWYKFYGRARRAGVNL